ncbi:isocitrate lyase/PEP mutase family protein [Minwuia thermotolerans]|uniref:2-methylisocitrate lyase n=1 Tax=Minwuia thermotolerans TaxID=2056226 RepID=A0A2M9FYA9_9PROT|nr:isocitrate lyase/phosphoenolpyruvate mutase family protein [Minwuia thermotolerans]PJK28419.1 2-methylisocitrate lyase [Minwuia thermotolerans]
MTAISDGFLKLHVKGQPFVMPNPWDIGSTRILESMGFPALATTSAGLAFSLGRRDAEGAVSRAEAIAHARLIAEATDLPVNGDLENGFGPTPEDCAETVRQAVEAGLAGCSIEDTTGDHANPIVPFELAVERVAAAAEAARQAGGLVLTARAENFLYGRRDPDDTIRRLNAFAEAGADVLYAPGLRDIETVRNVISAVDRPVNVLASPGLTVAAIAEAGAARISLGSAFALAALRGLVGAAEEVMERGSFEFASAKPGYPEISALMKGRG